MELAVNQRDTDILLKEKNVLNVSVLDKYRLAGQVTQTCLAYITSLINDSYHYGKHAPYSAAELCLLGDSYLASALKNVYTKGPNAVRERGIAQPVTIDVNDVVSGYSPEFDEPVNLVFNAGDIVTISLGCHIDGYTSIASHTVVIYPPGVQNQDGSFSPVDPLSGGPADAICAAHIATESVIALLGASLTPEKIPQTLTNGNSVVTGSIIRSIVDSIAESFNCTVVPTSKVRRIRRFLAGQAEGVLAERDFKGVVWSEIDQELKLLQKSSKFDESNKELVSYDSSKTAPSNNSSAIPTDDFVVTPGEVYVVDIKMAPNPENQPGLVTLQTVDHITGANHSKETFKPKPSVFVRDVAIIEQLKLKTSRALLTKIDKELSVYPFKLSHTSSSFPINLQHDVNEQLQKIHSDIKPARLGISEVVNKHLAVVKPIQRARFVPLQVVLNATTSTGANGFDAENPVLPGLEQPLPRLNMSSLKLKSLLKSSFEIPVARETATIVLNHTANSVPEIIRLSGGSKTSTPSWVHSKYQLSGPYVAEINALSQLTQDEKFGIKIKETQPVKITFGADATIGGEIEMQID